MRVFRFRAWRRSCWMALAFVAGCAAGPGERAQQGEEVLEGRVVLEGPIPRSWLATDPASAWIGESSAPPPGWDGTPPREIEVNPDGTVRGVAVWLEPVSVEAVAPPASGGDGEENRGAAFAEIEVLEVQMEGGCFWPTMIVVPIGGTLRFINADARLHHVQAILGDIDCDLLIPAGEAREIHLPAAGFARLSCNDHAFMRADLIVTPSAAFALTDAGGRFRFPEVPAGDYHVRIGHHRLKALEASRITVHAGDPVGEVEIGVTREDWKR